MKRLAIVTVNYNTAKDTNTLLDSIEKLNKKGISLHTFIIDNGSNDVYELPHHTTKGTTTLIRSEENTGFSGGYNLGIKNALKEVYDYILIVNNDTTMEPDLVEKLLEVLESKPEIGAVTPKIYFAKGHEFHKERYTPEELGNVFWYAGGFTDWNHVISVHRGVDEVDKGQYDTVQEIDFASGCCILFKKEVLEKVGLFDEDYFLYYEDADLNERIKRAGYKIYYVPEAILRHENASSSGGAGRGNVLQDYFITRNKMLFGMKYAPLRTKIALIRESLRLFTSGRPYQKKAIKDYYLKRFNKGTFFDNR